VRPRQLTCLDRELTEYAAGRLPEPRSKAWDRHLVACASCTRAVAQERRLQSLLVDDTPSMPSSLRGALLALSLPPAAGAATLPRRSEPGAAPLATLAPTAPPVHRSVLRSALVAAGAASITTAAAWSLAVGNSASFSAEGAPTTSASPTAPAAAGTSTAAVAVLLLGPKSPRVEPERSRRAQSIP
jgi:anti-sigma factor RsiW